MATESRELTGPFDLLEEARIPEEARRDAYEAVPPLFRSALKTGIALAAQEAEAYACERQLTRRLLHAGTEHASCRSPFDWALIVFRSGYSAAARMTRAAVLPRLCGTGTVFAVCLDGIPTQPVLLSLELSGCEDIFLLRSDDLTGLGSVLQTLDGDGMILSFCRDLPSILTPWEDSIRCLEPREPVLALEKEAENLFRADLLTFLHGTTEIGHTLTRRTDLLFTSRENAQNLVRQKTFPHLLVLTPGCEGYWRFPDLTAENCFRTVHTCSLI